MQQMVDPPPAGVRSRRFPPRRRTVAVTDPSAEASSPDDDRADALVARMDRLEAALRLVARANKEVLRTLDPRFDGRAELASVAERLTQLGGVADALRSELGRSAAEHETVRGELEGVRRAIEELTDRVAETAPARQPRPVTRLADVRARLARVSEELGQRPEAR